MICKNRDLQLIILYVCLVWFIGLWLVWLVQTSSMDCTLLFTQMGWSWKMWHGACMLLLWCRASLGSFKHKGVCFDVLGRVKQAFRIVNMLVLFFDVVFRSVSFHLFLVFLMISFNLHLSTHFGVIPFTH